MPRESVGDALNEIHTWLTSGGIFINVQPQPNPTPIEVRMGGQSRSAGLAWDSPDFQGNLFSVQTELTQSLRRQRFTLEAKRETDMVFTYSTVDEWDSWVSRLHAGLYEIDSELVRETREQLISGDAAFVLTVPHVGQLFRKQDERRPRR